jgi:hypothetical protein
VGGTATTAFASYTDIFADSRKWLRRGWVDYLAPQVYFAIGQTAANYSVIVPWWSQQVNPDTVRHVYIGQGAYRVSATATEAGFRSPSQLPSQIRLLRQQPNVQGSMYYKTTELLANPLGFVDSLQTNFYRHRALVPTMPWKDNVTPTPPVSASLYQNPTTGFNELSWQPGPAAADGERARWYVVYRIPYHPGPVTAADLADAANISAVTDTTIYREAATPTPYLFALTALDQLHNESAPANLTVLLSTALPAASTQFEPAFPNPFSSETRLAFTLPTAGSADLRVFDLTGREVAVLATGWHAAGRHEVRLRAADWPAGLYMVVLRTASGVVRQKVLRVQ